MACLITLKLEIKTLEKTFTRAHERFQIINASVDELTCRFIGRNGKKFDIHANITVSFLIFLNFFFAVISMISRDFLCLLLGDLNFL